MATWIPTDRIAKLSPPSGTGAPGQLSWPGTMLNSGNDYSVDFSKVLSAGETLVQVVFDVGDLAQIAWTEIFGPMATMWAVWSLAGTHAITVGVISNFGATYQTRINISVDPLTVIIPPKPPAKGGGGDGPSAPILPPDFTRNGPLYIAAPAYVTGAKAMPDGLFLSGNSPVVMTDGTTPYFGTRNNFGLLEAAGDIA